MNDNNIRNLAYQLWTRAGQPENRADHFWNEARVRTERSEQPSEPNDPTISEFDKSVTSENLSTFRGERMKMDAIFDNSAEASLGPPPSFPKSGILWHYTTGQTLLNIISNHEIWSTRLDCLSDSSEYRLAFTLLSQILALRPITALPSNERSFHDYLTRRFRERPRYFGKCSVACFSSARNDLSQWRAYGGAQGENAYAIGFDVQQLVESPRHLLLQRVEYRDLHLRRYLSKVIDDVFEFYLNETAFDSERQDLRRAWENITYTCFERSASRRFTSNKHEAFEGESEWRLVAWADTQSSNNFRFSHAGSMFRQHLPLTAKLIGFNDNFLPIREILIGPSRHAVTSKSTVENMLACNGYKGDALGWDVKVSVSDTPFQTT